MDDGDQQAHALAWSDREPDVDRALALELSLDPRAVDLRKLAQGERARSHQEVRHGDLLRAGDRVLELLTKADGKVDPSFDRDLELGHRGLGLDHAARDRRLHAVRLHHLHLGARGGR